MSLCLTSLIRPPYTQIKKEPHKVAPFFYMAPRIGRLSQLVNAGTKPRLVWKSASSPI